MPDMSRMRLEFATQAFLRELSRQWFKMNPEAPCPIKLLEQYPEAQRSALMAGIRKSVQSAEDDEAYRSYLEAKMGERDAG